MDWKELGQRLANTAPAIGTLLGGPAAGAVGAMIASLLGTPATPDAVAQAVATNPDAAVKLRKIEADERLGLQQLVVQQASNELAADTARIQAVNATMQGEATADHWPTYAWRPFIGFVFGSYIASMWVLPLFGKQPVALSADLTLAVGAILGVASWFRGRMQAEAGRPTDNRG